MLPARSATLHASLEGDASTQRFGIAAAALDHSVGLLVSSAAQRRFNIPLHESPRLRCPSQITGVHNDALDGGAGRW
jgi:hypothetical protein